VSPAHSDQSSPGKSPLKEKYYDPEIMTENKDRKNYVGNISPRHAASIEVSTVVSDMDLFPKFGASSRGRPSEDQISEPDPRLQPQREVLVSKGVPLCLELKMRSEQIIGSPTKDFTGEKFSDNGDFKFCELEVKFGEKLSNGPSEDSESLDQGSDHSELMIKEHYNSAHEIEMEALSVESNVIDLDGEILGRKSSSNKDLKFEICASDSVSNSESLKATSKDFDPNPAATDQNFDPMVSKDAHTQELSEIQEERETLNSRIMNESISGNYKQVREFYEDGSSYIGTKLNDKKHGQGALTLANGSKYDGDWKDDLMSGLGKLYYDSGKLAYKGGFFMNKVDGYGCMYNGQNMLKNSGTLLYSILSSDGFSKNGFVKPTEPASGMIFNSKINLDQKIQEDFKQEDLSYFDMDKLGGGWTNYEGTFREDVKDGMGRLNFMNGDYYKGEFSEDCIHGKGVFWNFKSKEKVFGVWNCNSLVMAL
jgi:hypothetical protein